MGRSDSIPSEARIRSGDETIPVGLTVVHLGDRAEEGGGIVVTLSDLRAIRTMQEEVRRLDRLAALGRFATSVAHEIRNPLAAIGAGIEYLSPALPPERQGDIALMRAEVTRLDRIVRDLLEPAQRRPLQKCLARVSSLITRACQANEPLAHDRGVRIGFRPPDGDATHPMQIEVDVDRMLQVIVNIVRNAIEASPNGEQVEIGWGAEAGAPKREVSIWVLDRGRGIPPDEIAHIFEPFYSTKSGGTGLGLYVSHGVVGLHGGTLSAETVTGAGARLTIRLPVPSA
jgi:signal transduction histidine kinase